MHQTDPLLTIVIPAFNEEHRLPKTLRRVIGFAQGLDSRTEVLVVDNASTDRTPEIARAAAADHDNVSLLHEPARGKGAAVRKGMLKARGEYLLVCDADLATPIEEIGKFLPPVLCDYDVAIASRQAPGAVRHEEPWYRHLMGRAFNLIVRLLAVPGIQDTQCGFKCFRREAARALFSVQTVDGWAFDVEVLHIAQRWGYRIVEVPIHWYYGEGSRVSPLRDSWNMLWEIFRIRRNSRAGLYHRANQPADQPGP